MGKDYLSIGKFWKLIFLHSSQILATNSWAILVVNDP